MQLDTNLTLHVCVKINSKANDRLEHEAWNHKNPRKKIQELSTLKLVMVMIFLIWHQKGKNVKNKHIKLGTLD